MATCKSCFASIRWMTTTNGKAIPVDPEPNEQGNLVLDSPGIVRVLTVAEAQEIRAGVVGALFMPHFATCPHAKEHKRS